MPLAKIEIPAGIASDRSDYSAGPRWIAGDKVRFQQGLPEKFGGWTKETGFTFNGRPSAALIWRDLSGNDLTAIGTDSKLFVVKNEVKTDITPIAQTVSTLASPPFAMSSGSPTVTVTDTARSPNAGDFVLFSGAAAAAGITISGEYEIKTIVDSDEYTITHSSNASSTATGGGASVVAKYLLSTGAATVTGLGWGAGAWSATGDGWGDPAATNASLEPPLWSLSNWGEDLIATKRGGGTYTWDASAGVGTRAAIISNAPSTALLTLVSVPDRHLVAIGAHDGSANDPLLVAWSDQEDNTTWAAAAANTAGSQRLAIGTRLMGALLTRDQILIWSDDAVYSMEFQGPPYTFGFRLLTTGAGLIAQNAAVEQNGIVYWMSPTNFFVYDGSVTSLPSPVRDYVYDDLNSTVAPFIAAGRNQRFEELLWFYASADSAENDRFVGVNYKSGEWQLGNLERTNWHDELSWNNNPIALDASGNLYYHETGVDDHGSAMSSSIETGAFEVPETGEFLFVVDKLITDATITGSLSITFYTRKYPGATEITKGPYTINSSTTKLSVRLRGRQLRFKLESTGIGDFWKWGVARIQFRPDSRR